MGLIKEPSLESRVSLVAPELGSLFKRFHRMQGVCVCLCSACIEDNPCGVVNQSKGPDLDKPSLVKACWRKFELSCRLKTFKKGEDYAHRRILHAA